MTHQSWSPYVGSSSIILAVVLLIATGVLIYFAMRFHHPLAVKRPGKVLRVFLVVIWVLFVATLLEAWSIYVLALYRQVGSLTAPVNPIAPVTMISGVVAFFVIAYLARRSGFWVALGSAMVGVIAAPMIFELPFDLIVMWRTYPPAPEIPFTLLFFVPLFLVEIASFALLTLSPVVKLSRATLFLLAGMFLIFAVWAWFGFAYPAAPIPIALNMISKMLAFATAISLFLPPETSAWFARQVVPARLQADQHPFIQSVSSLRGTEEYQSAPQTISRRTLIIGLATAGIAIAGGGFVGLVYRYPRLTYRGHTDWVYDVAWSPGGKRIASSSKDKMVQIWDATDGGHVFTYHGHSADVYSVAWSPGGKRIASSSKDKTVQVWDATDGGHVFTYRGHSDQVITVAWSPDGKRLASGGGNLDQSNKTIDKTVQVWDATDGSHVYTYRGHSADVYSVAWSPDGKRIASASHDKTVQVWDATDGSHIFTYRGHTDQVFTLAWSHDGQHIASGSLDTTVQVWDAVGGNLSCTYTGHTGAVLGVAWSPDDKRIASTSFDTTVQVWNAADGGDVYIYGGHSDVVITPAWSPDGKRIASSSYDSTVQVWSPW